MAETMSARELAEYLGLHYRTVLNLARRGLIPGRRVGGTWRFHRRTIEQWLSSPEAASSADGQISKQPTKQ